MMISGSAMHPESKDFDRSFAEMKLDGREAKIAEAKFESKGQDDGPRNGPGPSKRAESKEAARPNYSYSGTGAKPGAKPLSMTRAKQWSPEVEEAYRFQSAGWRDANEYIAKYGEPERYET